MRSLHLAFLLAPLVLGAASPQGGTAELHGARGTIRLRNFTSTKVDTVTGEVVFIGVGNPVVVEDTGSGVTLVAKSMRCTLKQNQKGEYTIEQATLADGAQVLMDTAVAAQAAADRAKRENKPLPAAPKVNTKTHLESDSMVYDVKGDEGTLVFPKAVDYSATSEGTVTRTRQDQKIEVPFNQLTRASGTQGRFTFFVPTDPDKDVSPRVGHLEGPVKFSLIRTETPPPLANAAAVPEATNINGVGDRFDSDFTQTDPTMTLLGNVAVDGTGRGFNGKVTGTKAVVTLDSATRQPKGYEFLGQPATTTIRNTKGGGR